MVGGDSAGEWCGDEDAAASEDSDEAEPVLVDVDVGTCSLRVGLLRCDGDQVARACELRLRLRFRVMFMPFIMT